MKAFLVGSGGTKEAFEEAQIKLEPSRLFSYFTLITQETGYGEQDRFKWLIQHFRSYNMARKLKPELFLDSGAYSGWSKGAPIDIRKYIAFVKEHEEHIAYYSVLDAIGDAEKTWRNQKLMEKSGLKPVPCFHYNEPIKYLKRYLENYDYISLGGMVPISTPALLQWLDVIFGRHICGSDGMPKVKIHGFGMTSHQLMIRYPWYSVDSTSWVLTGRHGAILIPRIKNGKSDFTRRPHVVDVSNKSSAIKRMGKHIDNFAPLVHKTILDYIQDKGYALGTSNVKDVESGYKLKKGERWFNRKSDMVEVVQIEGVSNNYRIRDEMNIIYFLDFEKSLPKWPWAFKTKMPKRFGR